jgi:predicted nucleic acid-binding protein
MNSLDTNVLVYAVSPAQGEREKVARKLLRSAADAGWPVAAQVYGEFFAVMTRRQHMTRKEARSAVETFGAVMPPMPSTVTAHAAALRLAAERQVQYWDALIIAVCAEHGVTQLYTEDAPSAPKLLGVKCVSPFGAT